MHGVPVVTISEGERAMGECVTCGATGQELAQGITGTVCADGAACEDRFTMEASAVRATPWSWLARALRRR